MRQLFVASLTALILACTLVTPVNAFHYTGISIVNHAISAGGVNGSTTGAIDTTGANFCAVIAHWYNTGASAPPLVSDSKSNTYSDIAVHDQSFGGGTRISYVYNPTVGAGHTFTVANSNTYSVISAACFSGVGSSPFDHEAGNIGSGGGTISTTSVTPSANNELVLTGVTVTTFAGAPATISGGGFTTILDFQDQGVGNNIMGADAYIVQGTAAASNPTWATLADPGLYATSIATFFQSSGVTVPAGIFTNTPIRCCNLYQFSDRKNR